MRFTKKIVLVMLATLLFGIDTTSAMSRIKELWSGSSKSKFTDAPTRTEAKQTESKSSSERPVRGYETTRSTLDELGIVGRSERSARDAAQSRNTRSGNESTEPAKESRSFLQRIMGKGRSEPKKEIEISRPTGFRVTTDESLARMKPEDAEKIRAAQAKENTKINITRPLDKTGDVELKKESPEEIATRMKRKDEQEGKTKQLSKDLANITNQLNETEKKLAEEMKKAPENRDQKLLKQLNLEKKKLGDKASSMEKTVKNIETRARLDGLNTQELGAEVARLQKQADQAKKDLAVAQAEQDLKTRNLNEIRKKLSPEDKQKYKDLAATHKKIEEKLTDKATPKDEISELIGQRKKIKTDMQNIGPDLANRHYELADQEATFVTAKKNVQLAQTSLTVAKSALEERITPKEPESIKTATTKKSVGFGTDPKSFEEFEKKAGPPPSKLPPLPPEADKTPNLEGISPAMRKILRDEETRFKQKQQPTSKTREEFEQFSST